VDAPVPFTFTEATLTSWEGDDRVVWLSEQMARSPAWRSLSGRRVVTAIQVLDRAFLSKDPVVRVVLLAVAVEVLLADSAQSDEADRGPTSALRIASRAAYLTCGQGCAKDGPACPYVLGFKGQKHLWATAKQWASTGEWRCSAFLDIARPPDMDAYFKRPSLFGARNEAVHEGRTSLNESDLRWMRTYSDQILSAYLDWIAARPTASVVDLDREVDDGQRRLGTLKPADS